MYNPSAINLQEALLRAWEQEQWTSRALRWCANIAGSLALLTLLLLLFVGGHDHFGLVMLSVYSIVTRLGAILIHRIFLYPRLLAEMNSSDPRRREAARGLVERHRDRLLADIARDRFLVADASKIAHLSLDDIAAWPELGDIDRWRRRGRRCLFAWLAMTFAMIATLRLLLA